MTFTHSAGASAPSIFTPATADSAKSGMKMVATATPMKPHLLFTTTPTGAPSAFTPKIAMPIQTITLPAF